MMSCIVAPRTVLLALPANIARAQKEERKEAERRAYIGEAAAAIRSEMFAETVEHKVKRKRKRKVSRAQ